MAGLLANLAFGQDGRSFSVPGYPDDARLLIIHADDLGLSQSTNAAVIKAFENNAINSGSIMVPCPWFPEIAVYAKENRGLDIGVHLTLTSEWKYFKWGSVMPRNKVPGLLDENGHFYATAAEFVANAKPAEVEMEVRAQIDRAIAYGIKPTHIDTHMATMLMTPELFRIYLDVAADYDVPAMIPANLIQYMFPDLKNEISQSDILVNTFMFMSAEDGRNGWAEGYREIISSLKPGINVLLVHLSYDNEEMRAIAAGQEDFGSAWRQNDLDYVMSKEFRDHLEEHSIITITWKELYEAIIAGGTKSD